jgi:hypothetical protein
MHGGHPRAIDKQVYHTNGPNLMGSIKDFASGIYGLLALKTIQVGGGDVFVGKLDHRMRGGNHRQERHREAPF